MAARRHTERYWARRIVSPLIAAALAAAAGVSHAQGVWPPFTVNDAATVARGATVTVLTDGASSVLANDFDIDGGPLTAELVEAPSHGSLTLNPDGTFSYVHNGSRPSSDRFRYRAFDGLLYSRVTDVDLAITGPGIAPQIIGQRHLAVPEDGSLQVAVTDFVVSDPDSLFPAEFSFVLDAGSSYSVSGATVTPDPDFNGTLTVPARVHDGESSSETFGLQVVVTAVNDAPVASAALPEQQATEGEAFELDVGVIFSDPDSGDRLTFGAAGLPPSRSIAIDPASGRLTGTPVESDVSSTPYSIIVTATDTAGAQASTTVPLRILPGRIDLSLAVTPEPKTLTADVSPTWTISIRNRGARASPATELAARWLSAPGTVTLTAPARCAVSGNSTAEVLMQCPIDSLAVDATDGIVVQTASSEFGDVAVIAHLTIEDADPSNDAAAGSLNLAGSFGKAPAQALPGAAASVASGDLDGDGREDVVTTGSLVRTFYGTAERAFEAGPELDTAAAAVALLDWNADGRLDVAVASGGNRNGRVFLNDGARGFTSGPELPVRNVRAALAADIDSDGVSDLVLAGAAGTRWVRRDLSTAPLHAAPAIGLASADFNGDGRADFVITDAGKRALHVLTNGTNGLAPATFNVTGSIAAAVPADVSGDGAPDVLLALDGADLEPPANLILRNTQDGLFERSGTFGQSATYALQAADVNGDGYADAIAVNASGSHQLYLGDGSGGLALQSELVLSPNVVLAKLGDLDGDGFPDLLLAGPDRQTVDFYRNDGRGLFGPGDVTPPVITLVGPDLLQVKVGEAYVDPGATATDDVEGDVTGRISASGTVDAAVVGTYTVVYEVADRSGNSAAPVQRTVEVQAAQGASGGGGGSIGAALVAVLTIVTVWLIATTPDGSDRAGSARAIRRRSTRSSKT